MTTNIKSERRSDIDWLRVIAVLLLVPFHAALIFIPDPNVIMYIKDSVNSVALNRGAGLLHQFHMPLLFFIAGSSSYFALKRRSGRQYLLERLKRLFIPAVFGIVVLVPPMTYITRIAQGSTINFWQHFTGFWKINPLDLSGLAGTFTPAHLWFLIFLFVFSLLALPIFMMLKSESCHHSLQKVADLFTPRYMIFLLAVPLALMDFVQIMGDKNPLYYFTVFCLGYLLMTDDRYQHSVDRNATIALVVGIVCEILRQTWHPKAIEWSSTWVVYNFIGQIVRWAWLIAIIGFGHRWLNHGSKLLNYLSKAAYPFYLLHLLNVTLFGFVIIQLPLGIAGKYFLIIISSTIVTFFEYEIVRRIQGLNVLFGIKPGRKEFPHDPLR